MPIEILLLSGKKPLDLAGASAQASMVAEKFASFVAAATKTLDLAIYTFNVNDPQGQVVAQALAAATKRGVAVRVAYFQQPMKPGAAEAASGGDPAGPAHLEALAAAVGQTKPIAGIDIKNLPSGIKPEPIEGGGNLMHNKYMIRDGSAVWMGSTNFTSGAWSVQDNNIVTVEDSAPLAAYYTTDFNELWSNGRLAGTGKNDSGSVMVGGIALDLDFSPGDGATIETKIAGLIAAAKSSVTIASMVISSGSILEALVAAMARGVKVTGVYDGPQQANVLGDWSRAAAAHTDSAPNPNVANWAKVAANLVGKKSIPFRPDAPDANYNFMHNKAVVLDGQIVATGSFNYSSNATHNAENVLTIHDPAIAHQYADYIIALPKGW